MKKHKAKISKLSKKGKCFKIIFGEIKFNKIDAKG